MELDQYESWNQRNDYPDPPTCEYCGFPLGDDDIADEAEMHEECAEQAEAEGYFM